MADLSIVVPSIRIEKLGRFLDSIPASIGKYTYEVIVVSPYYIPYKVDEVITCYGSPSVGLQKGQLKANSDIFTWGTDDGVYLPGQLEKCIDILRGSPSFRDGVIVKYTEEGPGTFTGALDEYYVSANHEANRQPGINPKWKIAPVGMFYTRYWREIGGIDCRFEHINMNIHDFVYRLQKDGGELHYSDGVVMHCDSNNWGAGHRILDESYIRNDLPLFKRLYKDDSRKIVIDINNWENQPLVWRRFIK